MGSGKPRKARIVCEVCNKKVGSHGHRCQTPFCRGTLLRAERILEAGVDVNGEQIDAYLKAAIKYTLATRDRR